MSEKKYRNRRILALRPKCHKRDILDGGPIAATVKIAKVIGGPDASAMSPVIVYYAGKTSGNKITHQRVVPFLVLTHSMYELYDCHRLVRRNGCYGQFKAVAGGCQSECSDILLHILINYRQIIDYDEIYSKILCNFVL